MRLSYVLLVLAACGGGGNGGDADGPLSDAGPADPQFTDPANQILIREDLWGGSTASGEVNARFADGATGWYSEQMRMGSCRLMTSSAEYCQGPGGCTGWCIDDVCQEYPTYRDAGRITTSGLKDSVSLTFNTGYYAPDSFPIASDLFDGGDAITATAAGADFPGFTVGATGVATIEPQFTGSCHNEWHITRGQTAAIHWDSPVSGARVHLWIPSTNRGHGLPSQAVIECEGRDTGGFDIASALVDGMPDFVETEGCNGIACVGIDCPPSTIERYTTGTASAGSESVELRVSSAVTFLVYDN